MFGNGSKEKALKKIMKGGGGAARRRVKWNSNFYRNMLDAKLILWELAIYGC
jgi:hypothetical protein